MRCPRAYFDARLGDSVERLRRDLLFGMCGLSFLVMSSKVYAWEFSMNFTLEDMMIASRTIWGEGRGETMESKLAIAHVLMNRWRSTTGQWSKDDTLAKTCLRPWQFSAWNSNDPNLPKMQKVDVDDGLFVDCMIAVLTAYKHPLDDPTSGSRHYITTALLNRGFPKSWGKPQKPVIIIGSHAFFNGIA